MANWLAIAMELMIELALRIMLMIMLRLALGLILRIMLGLLLGGVGFNWKFYVEVGVATAIAA